MPTIHGHADQIRTSNKPWKGTDCTTHGSSRVRSESENERRQPNLGGFFLDDGVSADDLGSQTEQLSESARLMAGSHPDLHCLQKEDAAYSDN